MPNGSSGWPNLYSVSGTRDALTALLDIPDLLFEDHGQFVRDDGTLAATAYATDAAAAAAAAAQPTVTMTLLLTGDQMYQRAQAEIAGREGGGGVA
jgi:hypothetical protein